MFNKKLLCKAYVEPLLCLVAETYCVFDIPFLTISSSVLSLEIPSLATTEAWRVLGNFVLLQRCDKLSTFSFVLMFLESWWSYLVRKACWALGISASTVACWSLCEPLLLQRHVESSEQGKDITPLYISFDIFKVLVLLYRESTQK